MIAKYLKNFSHPPVRVLFLAFFFIYFAFGLFISYLGENISKYDMVLGTDSPRVFADFLYANGPHLRTSVHPLQLFLLQPLFLIANVFLHSPKVSVLLVQALCGAIIVCLIYNILILWTKNNKLSILISIIHGISCSALVFTSLPETYIFSAFCNTLLLYYIGLLYKKEELTAPNAAIVSILAVFCFGIIPANIIPNLILFIGLLSFRYKHGLCSLKSATCIFLKALCLMLFLYVIFTFAQKFAYPDSPAFFKDVKNTETRYFNLDINFKKTTQVFEGTFAQSLYAPKLATYKHSKLPVNVLTFKLNQNFIYYIPSILLFGLILSYLIFKKSSKEKFFALSVAAALLTHCVQLYFYGTKESFLYSQNPLPYLIILLGFAFSKLPTKAVVSACVPFIICQCILNLPLMFKIEKHLNFDALKHYNIALYMLCSLITTIIICIICYATSKLLKQDILELPVEKKFTIYLGIFIIFILINCIFLGIFHGKQVWATF